MFRTNQARPSVWPVSLVGAVLLVAFAYFLLLVPTTQAATVGAPVFPYGPFQTHTKISLTSSTSGAKIYYTFALGSQPADPTSSSNLYSTSDGTIDLQLPKDTLVSGSTTKVLTKGGGFKAGTYYIKAVAYSGSSKSAITSASYPIGLADQSVRNSLSSLGIYTNKYTNGPYSGQNKPDCWMYNLHSNCTSFYKMNSATVSEIKSFESACRAKYGKTTKNYCGVVVSGGTEFGHAAGTYSHQNGYKFDMPHTSLIDSFIKSTVSPQFTQIANRSGDNAPQWKRNSNGYIYADEGSHWDVLVK